MNLDFKDSKENIKVKNVPVIHYLPNGLGKNKTTLHITGISQH